MKRANVTYEELAARMKDHGFAETRASISAKLQRGTFAATFLIGASRCSRTGEPTPRGCLTMKLERGTFAAAWLFACIAALGLEGIHLEQL